MTSRVRVGVRVMSLLRDLQLGLEFGFFTTSIGAYTLVEATVARAVLVSVLMPIIYDIVRLGLHVGQRLQCAFSPAHEQLSYAKKNDALAGALHTTTEPYPLKIVVMR